MRGLSHAEVGSHGTGKVSLPVVCHILRVDSPVDPVHLVSRADEHHLFYGQAHAEILPDRPNGNAGSLPEGKAVRTGTDCRKCDARYPDQLSKGK